MTITVHAGPHPRNHCPLRIEWPDDDLPRALRLGDVRVPLQRDGRFAAFLPLRLDAGAAATYAPASAEHDGGVVVTDTGERIEVRIDGALFTQYWYRDVPARPYFWPVHAPGDVPVTRAYPMATVDGEVQDHPHQRSLYFAFGDVNGVDNWSELPGHGYTAHQSVDAIVSGPVFGRFSTTSAWTDRDGAPVLHQSATVTIWRGDGDLRLMDVDLRLTARDQAVRFGDTKEGGILTVRIASDFDVDRKLGGRIENSFGGIDEAETWGRAAHWCDYSGLVDGARYGVAVMDHPDSFRYPTFWHVRDYGLMAANPFALKAFTARNEVVKDGSHTLPAGETLRFVYRVVVHRGGAADAGIGDQYLNFVSPPRVTREEG